MVWAAAFSLSPLLVVSVIGAAVQHPLQNEGQDPLTKLRIAVGSRLLKASPIPMPCYALPGPFNEEQCVAVNKSLTKDWWVSDQPSGYFYNQSNWASCQATGESCSLPIPIDPKANISDKATAIDEVCFQGNLPDLVINVTSTSDIQAAFEYVKVTKTPLIIKNTGHDWKGRSAGSGSLALWTHHLREPLVPIVYDTSFAPDGCWTFPNEKVLHLGGGETWGNAYRFADSVDRAILGGTCGSVGIAGWLSGGGHSPFTAYKGLGVDNVRQVEIVTPNGTIITANECQNKDLFFAVRGGGGGTFGVVTKITYKTFEKFRVQQFSAKLDKIDKSTTAEFLKIVTASALGWAEKGWGGYMRSNLYIDIVKSTGTLDEAKKDMENITAFLERNKITPVFKTQNSSYDWQKEVWGPTEKHPGAWSASAASRLLNHTAFESESRLKLVDALTDLEMSNLSPMIMLVTPTTFKTTADSALHPSWKHAIWSVRINDKWDQFRAADSPIKTHERFRQIHDSFEPIRYLGKGMGISINEADIWEENSHEGFWGQSNYEKLQAVKKTWDPENLLSNWQAVGFDWKADRYKCYPKPTRGMYP